MPFLPLALALAGLVTGVWLAALAVAGARAVARERAVVTSLSPDEPDGAATGAPALALLSVLVPARNEAGRIGPCVRSLLGLDYPAVEVIVVDDGSTDRTAEAALAAAAGDPRLRVLEAGPLPAGWSGKSHALWRGQAAARGAWLLFTDADTRHARSSLRLALREARARSADLLSLTGHQAAVSLPERLVQPFVFEFLARRFPLSAVNDPADPRAAANGQYLLVARRLYDAIGGHAAVRAELLEDVALARLAKRRGARIAFLSAPALLEARMYEDARSLGEGWTKNLADLAGGPAAALAEGMRLLARGLGPLAGLGAAALALAAGRPELTLGPALLAAPALAALLGGAAALAPSHGTPRAMALLAPAGAAATGALFLRSAWRRSGKRQIAWRGRRYPAAA